MTDRLTKAIISIDDYSHNLAEIRKLIGDNVQIMAVVKANAYGHGIEKIAQIATASGVSYFGVVSLGELKQVRSAHLETPVLLLNYLDQDSINEVIDLNGTITVMDTTIATYLASLKVAQPSSIKVHLKVDTGMHRAGCNPEDALTIARIIHNSPGLELEGVFTHFAEADDTNPDFTKQQLALFNTVLDELHADNIYPRLIHASNSSATIAFPDAHFTMVRPGLITYGLNPFPQDHEKYRYVANHFKPVLSLETNIVHLRTIKPGESTGYNRKWIAERKSNLALLPVGYGDGYRRNPHKSGRVILSGQLAPIVGTISMDQTIIDVTDLDGTLAIGDRVTLIGKDGQVSLSADDLALSYNTINYEVVTSLSDRITREYI